MSIVDKLYHAKPCHMSERVRKIVVEIRKNKYIEVRKLKYVVVYVLSAFSLQHSKDLNVFSISKTFLL